MTNRIQFEGDNGIICILCRNALESSIDFSARYVSKCNELRDVATRARLIGIATGRGISATWCMSARLLNQKQEENQ